MGKTWGINYENIERMGDGCLRNGRTRWMERVYINRTIRQFDILHNSYIFQPFSLTVKPHLEYQSKLKYFDYESKCKHVWVLGSRKLLTENCVISPAFSSKKHFEVWNKLLSGGGHELAH